MYNKLIICTDKPLAILHPQSTYYIIEIYPNANTCICLA